MMCLCHALSSFSGIKRAKFFFFCLKSGRLFFLTWVALLVPSSVSLQLCQAEPTAEVISHHTLSCVTQFPTWLDLRATHGDSIPTATLPKRTHDRELHGLTQADFINRRLEVNQFRIDPRPGALSDDTALSIGAGCLLSESDLMVITGINDSAEPSPWAFYATGFWAPR